MGVLYKGKMTAEQTRKERLFMLLLSCATVMAVWILLDTDRGEPAMNQVPVTIEQATVVPFCADDEVMVRVEEAAFDFHAGQLVCVHIDNWRNPK